MKRKCRYSDDPEAFGSCAGSVGLIDEVDFEGVWACEAHDQTHFVLHYGFEWSLRYGYAEFVLDDRSTESRESIV